MVAVSRIFVILATCCAIHLNSVWAHEAAERAPSGSAPPALPGPAASTSSSTAASVLPFNFGGAFALTDQNGRLRTDADFRGTFMLVFFGYAGCEDMCPLTLGAMASALDALGSDAARVRPVFITVDPERDTPARLRRWARRIHPRLVALTGDPAAIRLAMRAYKVHRTARGKRPDGAALFAHGMYAYLMRPDGRFAALVPPSFPPDAMAALLRRHLDAMRVDGGSPAASRRE